MNKRDLKADLELCNKATPGPWGWHESDGDKNAILNKDGDEILLIAFDFDAEYPYIDSWCKEADLKLIVQAREGWPHAIKRAHKAEAINRELAESLKKAVCELDVAIRFMINLKVVKLKEVEDLLNFIRHTKVRLAELEGVSKDE